MMFDCGYAQKDKFVRLDDLDSTTPTPDAARMNKCRFGIEGLNPVNTSYASKTQSNSFKRGMMKGSEGLRSIGRSLRFGVSRAVFPEDLKVSEKKIFDPQDKFLQLWNKLFVASCILSVSVDPFFFFLPIINPKLNCLGIDRKLAIAATTVRTVIDVFYLIRMALQFRTAYIAPSSRVFGRGELVIDPAQIAKRYLLGYFVIDFLAVLPLPQIVIWRYLRRLKGSDVYATKQALLFIVLIQYVPRFVRIIPLFSELKRTSGVFAETAWAGAAYYLLLYMLCSHIVGALWYLLGMERNDFCWQKVCHDSKENCTTSFLYCDNQHSQGYDRWSKMSVSLINATCSGADDNDNFDFGIFQQALTSGIYKSGSFISKYCYCLWWGLQNLSTLGQGLQTSTYPGEVIFSIALAIFGLILFALLIGNMQTYLQSVTIRLEEMRVKRRDSEQWMHHRLLPQELRERVRRYDQYKWLETRGVDEDSLVRSLPKDLRRDIKRHLCLALVRRVPLFDNMDERLLDAICERLKPSLYTEKTYILREGDPVDEMLFIIRGRLESETTDGGRSGFLNRSFLKEGDFCGDELLTWALDPKSGVNLPSSTRTVKAITEVEAFALEAEELKFVASQFRRLHSRQVQHTFRFYSQQWRTWAARFIQAAWRRYLKRKLMEQQRRKEEEEAEANLKSGGGSSGGVNNSSSKVGGSMNLEDLGFGDFQNASSKSSTSNFASGNNDFWGSNSGSVPTMDSFATKNAAPPVQSSGGDSFDMFFSSSVPAGGSGGGGVSGLDNVDHFSGGDDWGMESESEFGGGHDGGSTTEIEGLPPPPVGVSASTAKAKGLDNYKQGQFADAIKWLSWAEVLLQKAGEAAGSAEVLTCRASCYKEVGEYKKAVADCTKVLDNDGTNVTVLVQRALLYESMEKYRLGADDLRTVMKLDPGNRVARSTIHRLNKMAD